VTDININYFKDIELKGGRFPNCLSHPTSPAYLKNDKQNGKKTNQKKSV